uniref:Ubiquitin-like protease family profile domain-containing protein n=1 Tax=Trichogramma kaykai TaxID=54128 RepID=A0ABD2WG83_9HYME
MHKLSRNKIKRYVFLPNLEDDHWTLHIVDILEKKLMHLDPKKFERTGKEFSKTTKRACNSRGGNVLNKIKWKISPFPEKYHLQKDNVHCGVFVMHFMDVIGSNKHFDDSDTPFDPVKCRTDIAR